MAFVPIPATIKVALVYRAAGNQEIVNTLYFKKDTGSIAFADLGVVEAAVQVWWNTNLKPLIPTSVTLDRIETRDVSAQNSFERTLSSNTDGLNPGSIAPLSVTKRINFGTGIAGRSFKGANYWPAFLDSDVGGNVLTGTILSDIEAGYATLTVAGGSGPVDFTWVVASTVTNNAERTTGVTTEINNVYTAGTDVDVMRSRVDA